MGQDWNDGLARLARVAGPDVVTLVEGISDWALTLQGQMPLRRGLAALAEAFGAEAVALSRIPRQPGATPRALVADRGTSGTTGGATGGGATGGRALGPRIERSFAPGLLGPYVTRPRVGTVWYSSLEGGETEPALRRLQDRRRLAELVVAVIGVEDKAVHFLEFHFTHRLPAECHGLLTTLAGPLVSMWERRAVGCFSEALLAGQGAQPAPAGGAILSLGNPARLSRAEFRVCTLLAAGLSARRVCEELGVSQSTLRSHLRQIYAKTGTAGLAELLYRLLAPEAAADPAPGAMSGPISGPVWGTGPAASGPAPGAIPSALRRVS